MRSPQDSDEENPEVDDEIEQCVEIIRSTFGTEDGPYEYLESQLSAISQQYFGGELTPVRIQLVPPSLLAGVIGGIQRAGARYEEPDGDYPAQIMIPPALLQSPDYLREVLIYELVHHWETTSIPDKAPTDYPAEIDELTAKAYPDPKMLQHWKNQHSALFIAKVVKIAADLAVHPARLLSEPIARAYSKS